MRLVGGEVVAPGVSVDPVEVGWGEVPPYTGVLGGSDWTSFPVSRHLMAHAGWNSFHLWSVSYAHVPNTEMCSPTEGIGRF
jgi:hypothetical protein